MKNKLTYFNEYPYMEVSLSCIYFNKESARERLNLLNIEARYDIEFLSNEYCYYTLEVKQTEDNVPNEHPMYKY